MQASREMSARNSKQRFRQSSCRPWIGPLEAEAMRVLWELGECSVRGVMDRLPQKMAYTTVMTTLTRLYTKRLLKRRKVERKFLYRPRFRAEQWRKQAAMEAAIRFLGTPGASRELLMSCLQDAIALQDSGTHLADSDCAARWTSTTADNSSLPQYRGGMKQ